MNDSLDMAIPDPLYTYYCMRILNQGLNIICSNVVHSSLYMQPCCRRRNVLSVKLSVILEQIKHNDRNNMPMSAPKCPLKGIYWHRNQFKSTTLLCLK